MKNEKTWNPGERVEKFSVCVLTDTVADDDNDDDDADDDEVKN